MAEASSPSAATAASPPRRRSSLRRVQTAREKWEAHRARQKLVAEAAAKEEEQQQQRDDGPCLEVAEAVAPSKTVQEPIASNATSASVESASAPAFDRRAHILRAKKRGDGAPVRQVASSAKPTEDKGPAPNPFANISLTSASSTKPTFSFAASGAASAPSFSFTAAGGTSASSGKAAECKGSSPLAASAPKPVGLATAGESKEKPKGSASSSSSGGGYPPLSAAAPKPFSSTTTSDEGGSASSCSGGGGYPPLATAAPNPFAASSKDNTTAKSTASPFANLSLGGSSASSSPFGFHSTTTAGNTSAGVVRSSKNIFGGTGAFGGGDVAFGEKNASEGTGGTNIFGSSSAFGGGAAFGGGNSGASTGFSFGTKGTTPSPFGPAPAGGTTPSPFGAPAASTGSSPFSGGFGKSSVNAPTPAASTQDGQSGKGDTDYKARLTEFYKEHNPDKLPAVDANLAKYQGKEDEMFRKLYQRYGLDANGKKVEDPFLEPGGTGPRVYMDLSMGGTPMGRIVMQLYADKTPITAENFRGLCTGFTTEENGERRELQKTYATNHFHRIVPGMCFQGGDITCGNGTGGRSIYPANDPKYKTDGWGKFADETPFMKHSKRGLLSMANAGANQNSSQFFITMKELPYLNGKHVIFGEVLEPSEDGDDGRGDGMKVLDRIMQTVEVDPKNHRPKEECRVVIDACGEFT